MNRIKHTIASVRHWLNTHKKISYAIVAVGILAFAGLSYVIVEALSPRFVEPAPIHVKKPEKKYYSPLTGVKVADESATKQLVTAIMIENSPDARPHSGLQQAGVVYEAIAEGGITRYVALYQQAKPDLIGPVRSLRPYFLDWVAPYDASIAHVGGSAKALNEVRNGNYRDIDQFFNAPSYWRASDRYAPHNVYTNFERLDKLNNSKDYKASSFTGFERSDGKVVDTPDATDITVNFSSALYNTRYVYDVKSNTYRRYLGGEPHQDREKGAITPSVVIAMQVDETTAQEDGPRQVITTTGSGKATIFQNGTVIQGSWRKTGTKNQLTWLDSAGKPIKLVRGQTWIAAVPNGRGSVSW